MEKQKWGTLRDIGVKPGDKIISRGGGHDGRVVDQAMIDIWQYPDYAKMEEKLHECNDNRNS